MFNKGLDYAQSLFGTHFVPKGLSWRQGWCMPAALVTSLFLVCGAAAAANSSAGPASPAPTSTAASNRVAVHYGKIPLSFEANRGQAAPHAQYLSRGSGYSLFLAPGEVVLNLERQGLAPTPGSVPEPAPVDTLRMKLLGANTGAAVAGVDPQPGVVSYFIGNDPKKWHTGIPTYGKVKYSQVYPGVDLVFYGNQRQLEYDFVVAPGADPGRIAWQIDGSSVALDAQGDLVLSAAHGPASFKKPALYQMDGEKKIGVEGSFEVAGSQIRFQMGGYDHSRALIIDPVLSYASYLSGSGSDEIGLTTGPGDLTVGTSQALAVDSEGSAYVTGYTYSIDFPTKDAYQSTPPAKVSGVPPGKWPTAFVTKFSPDGDSLAYSTYLGGNGYDFAYAIAVDSDHNAYVTGQTDSPNFPTTSGAYQTICDETPYTPPTTPSAACGTSNVSAFVTKLNSSGSGLVYSTFFGGYAYDYATAIAVDTAGRAYIAGDEEESCDTFYTYEGCFPTTTGAVIPGSATTGGSAQYAFVSAFDPTGAQLLYSTIFGDLNFTGEGGTTWGTGVAVDAKDYFYLVGETSAGKLPTTKGVIQPTSGPLGSTGTYIEAYRGFIAKFNPVTSAKGASLDYATYLGGHTEALNDYISGITIDSDSNAYVVGYTNSPDFPVTKGAYSTVCGPNGGNCAAAHVTKLNPSATSILWSTFVGGAKSDGSDALFFTGPIQLDGDGNVYIMGQPGTGFPMVNPAEPTPIGGDAQVLVAELDPTGKDLLFSTIIGSDGLDTENPAGLAVDTDGNIYLAGNTVGPDLITTPGAFQTKNTKGGCCYAGFVAKIAAHGTATAALSASPSPALADQTVTLKATITGPKYGSAPTGTVMFENGSTVMSTVDLNSAGVATYPTSFNTANTYDLSAVYSGDSTYASETGKASLTVTNPVPTLTSLSPSSAATGGAAFTLTVNGSNFVNGSIVKWNGADRTTVFVSPTQLTASILATDIATTTTVPVTVFNPTPGGGTSGSKTFTVAIPVAGVSKTMLTFTGQNMGTTSASQSVTLSNTGKAVLTIASIAASANFGTTNTCAGIVAPAGSCTINVTFSPTATGTLTGTLTITDNSNAVAGTKQTVTLTGTGLPAVAVTLSPASKSLALGATQVFTATISNATNPALNWYVNGVQNGNAAQGTLTACTTTAPLTCTYTAPPVDVPSPNPAVIKLASVEDPTKFKTASVTVTDSIAVTLSPTSKSLALGATQVFTATITGTNGNAVLNWYVNGVQNGNAAQGTLTACTTTAPLTCTYTAPPVGVPSPNPAVIKVASSADPGKNKTANVTVTDPIAVTLSPTSQSLALGATQVFTATITGATSNAALNWYVNGVLKGNAAQGTLTACTTTAPLTCTYTAPPVDVPNPNPAVIKVASSADPGKNKTANVTVTDPIAVTLSPTSQSLALGATQVFTATITGATSNAALNWYVNGVLKGNAAQGTLTACTTTAPLTCTYTAPPVDVPNPNPAVIKVASSADPGKNKTANVTVTDPIAVTLNPTSQSLALGATQVFTATITGATTNAALNWYVNGVLKGNAAQGTLTACTTTAPLTCTYTVPPVNVPNPNPAVIKVASSADPGKYKTANVTVTDSIAVTLSPSTKTLALGGTQVFTATISGTSNTALNWYVSGVLKGNATQGTLTACTTVAPLTCTYTAPTASVPSPNPAVIEVASAADPSKSKTADVTVTAP
jgi:hypothetical protein